MADDEDGLRAGGALPTVTVEELAREQTL